MNISVTELSQRLQQALDNNYNVVDMVTVLDIISRLEGTHVTKEQLETTRLARFINELRRKTPNESLARRSKNLLKKWREMVIPAANPSQQQQFNQNVKQQQQQHLQHQQQQQQQKQQQQNYNKKLITTPSTSQPPGCENSNSFSSLSNNQQSNFLSNCNKSSSPSMFRHHQLLQQKQQNNFSTNSSSSNNNNNQKGPTDFCNIIIDQNKCQPYNFDRSHSPNNYNKMLSNKSVSSISKSATLLIKDRPGSPSTSILGKRSASLISSSQEVVIINDNSNSSSTLLQPELTSAATTICDKEYISYSNSKKHKKSKKNHKRKGVGNDNSNMYIIDEESSNCDVINEETATNLTAPFQHTDQDSRSVTPSGFNANYNKYQSKSQNVPSASSFANNNNIKELTFSGRFSKSSAALPTAVASTSTSPPDFNKQFNSVKLEPNIPTVVLPKSSSVSPVLSNSNGSNLENKEIIKPVMPILGVSTGNKKRGRRKKAAKMSETESSHLDIQKKLASISTSSTKKVKTTKELLADLQNRKYGTNQNATVTTTTSVSSYSASASTSTSLPPANMNLVNLISATHTNSPSSCSEMSLLSHSTDIASTPEPIGASVKTTRDKDCFSIIENKKSENRLTIDEEIKELMSQLPPISYTFEEEEEEEVVEEEIPCTCEMIEVPFDADVSQVQANLISLPASSTESLGTFNDNKKNVINSHGTPHITVDIEASKPAIKSIFDLDDDDDLIEVKQESNTPAKLASPVVSIDKMNENSQLSLQIKVPKTEPIFNDPQMMNFDAPEVKFTKWEQKIDDNCPAMKFYESSRNIVTNYHVEQVHTKFIPGVNGNWNTVPVNYDGTCDMPPSETERVVPRLVHDKIPKHFRDYSLNKTVAPRNFHIHIGKVRRGDGDEDVEMEEDKNSSLSNEVDNYNSMAVSSASSLNFSPSSLISNNNKVIVLDSDSNDSELLHNDNKREDDNDDAGNASSSSSALPKENNNLLPSFNLVNDEDDDVDNKDVGVKDNNDKEKKEDRQFSEWFEPVNVTSYNDELLTVLPYVVIVNNKQAWES